MKNDHLNNPPYHCFSTVIRWSLMISPCKNLAMCYCKSSCRSVAQSPRYLCWNREKETDRQTDNFTLINVVMAVLSIGGVGILQSSSARCAKWS